MADGYCCRSMSGVPTRRDVPLAADLKCVRQADDSDPIEA
jgi:hypothetical protein